ncbi:hypothetical protein BOTBODRAFT_173423 [Botryobasidium botryosum FD-172 SS1]|uniref:HNH nuclease domain-containing protein n=1 Tax=Botryobasidium botryosum (strain FD-172 SS1) TaxID=930990 RepID=A0A067MW82_BOTB1|nr:hypothetical protein BOTBODRAFT_173423 [Botryobasidium botryosum FD-172 SS1]
MSHTPSDAMHINLHAQVEDGLWLHFLSIPFADVRRLCHRPLKWLRFVSYTICGAEGNISMTPGGDTVDYDDTLIEAGDFYYKPQGSCHFVDPGVVSDRDTVPDSSMDGTPPCSSFFWSEIERREGNRCIFSGEPWCEAAHIVPQAKGHNYLAALIHGRADLYNVDRNALQERGIESVENGLYLSSTLHAAFKATDCAILKTPNFALNTDDIPCAHAPDGAAPEIRCTLQFFAHWEDVESVRRLHNIDAQFTRGTGVPQPWSLLLDFMYGAIVFQKWASGDGVRKWLSGKAAQGIFAEVAAMPLVPESKASEGVDVRGQNLPYSREARKRNHGLK